METMELLFTYLAYLFLFLGSYLPLVLLSGAPNTEANKKRNIIFAALVCPAAAMALVFLTITYTPL